MFIYGTTESDDVITNDGFDFTFGLEPLFTGTEKILIRARLGYVNQDKTANLVIVVGFRSSIKGPDVDTVLETTPFLPCDLFGLLPGVAVIASHRAWGIVGSALAREDTVRLLMVLKGESSQRQSVGEALDNLVIRLSRMWEEWSQALLRILKNDPILNGLGIDIREYLAVESGYNLMPWYRAYSHDEHLIIKHRIVSAAKAFLSSVLELQQMKDPLVISVLNWLDHTLDVTEPATTESSFAPGYIAE
jgi:hypothetical protein